MFVFANTLPIICVISASVLMWYNKDGWGWLVFIAIITACVPRTKDDNEEKETK